MSLSIGMNSGLLALININNQITDVSKQLQTGKRFNSAADGAVQWLQISDFTNRASALTKINDGLTVGLSQTKNAATTLASIRAKLVSAQSSLNDAYTSQQAVTGTSATTDTTSANANTFQFNVSLDPNSTNKSFNAQTVLDGNLLINNTRVHSGDVFTVGVGTKSVSFKIAPDSATVAATTQSALDTINAKVTADSTALTNANTAVTNATTAVGTAKTNMNAGIVGAGGVAAPFQLVVANAAGQNVAAAGINANAFNIAYVNVIANAAGINATALTAQQYIDGLRNIQNGTLSNAAVNANGAGGLLNNIAAVAQGANTAMSLMSGYVNALKGLDLANQNQTLAQSTLTADQATQTFVSNNVQNGGSNPYLVATVKDYMNVLKNLKDAAGNNAITFDQAVPDDYSPITAFSATATASQALTVSHDANGSSTDSADGRNLFKSTYKALDASVDTTKAYDVSSWQQNGSKYTLSNTHHTGAAPGSVTTQPDAKRKVAANTFRQMMTDINQLVKDTALNGVNLLTGSKLSVTLNADGDKFNFQLTNDDGTAATFNSTGIGLDAKAAKISKAAGDTNNDFSTNTDMDTALAQLTNALSKIDTATGLVGDAQSSLQNRSDFNKSTIDLLNTTATALNAIDSNAASAQLASLQTQQSFATSIMSIMKQSDQSALQLLR